MFTSLRRHFSENFKNPYFYLYFLLILIYIIIYMPYGFEDGDMGTIFSISWSMYQGEFPYRDFVYIKPPFSPYFHSLFLYLTEEYAYLLNRGFYYIQIFIYSLLASRLLFNAFNIRAERWIYCTAIIGALLSIHNYPPMPWNTIDGLFFIVIGMTFLFKEHTEKVFDLALGALFISLGVLCKQSFFFMPVFITCYFLLHKQFKKSIYFVAFGIGYVAIFLSILIVNGALEAFIHQIFSFTPSSSFVDTGIKVYYLAIKFNIFYIVIVLLLFVGIKKYFPGNPTYVFLNSVIAVVFIYLFLSEQSNFTARSGLIQAFLVVTGIMALWKSLTVKKYYLLVLMLALAWCAAISNGYNTPIDFSIAIIFGLLVMSYDLENLSFSYRTGFLIISIYLITFFIGYQYVYMDSERKDLTYSMGTVFPQLKGIKSDKETFNKYKELKQLSAKYKNYTVLPSVTLANYLTYTKNPIGVDWLFDHHLSDQIPLYKEKLKAKNVTVFLENFEGHINNYEETSALSVYVRDYWRLVETTQYFRVYKKP